MAVKRRGCFFDKEESIKRSPSEFMKTLSALDLTPEQEAIVDFVRSIQMLRWQITRKMKWLSQDLKSALKAGNDADFDDENTVKNYFTIDFYRDRMRSVPNAAENNTYFRLANFI